MKNVQVRFTNELYGALEQIAAEDEVSLSDVVRSGIQLYGIVRAYAKEGKILGLIDADTREVTAELVIPGINSKIKAPSQAVARSS